MYRQRITQREAGVQGAAAPWFVMFHLLTPQLLKTCSNTIQTQATPHKPTPTPRYCGLHGPRRRVLASWGPASRWRPRLYRLTTAWVPTSLASTGNEVGTHAVGLLASNLSMSGRCPSINPIAGRAIRATSTKVAADNVGADPRRTREPRGWHPVVALSSLET